MEHFYQNIDGWFSYEDIYRAVVDRAEDGDLFVEIGSFKGRSSSFMAVEIINSGKAVKFDCIDTWRGAAEHQNIEEVINDTLYDVFTENMKPVEGHYTAIRMPSVEAAALYEDASIDFLLIDGDHTFEAVCADIAAFLPKMKKGGIMAGDDAWQGTDPRRAAEHMFGNDVDFPGIHFIHYVK